MGQAKYPKFLLIKVSQEMDAEIRRRARADDRTLSGMVRRLLAAALTERSDAVQQ